MGILRAMGAVAGGMIGVRRGSQASRDWSEIKPWHVVAAGLAGLAAFVLALVLIVSQVAG